MDGPNLNQGRPLIAQANRPNTTTPLSELFTDPFVAQAFRSAEDGQPDGLFAVSNPPPVLTGGAVEELEVGNF